MIKIFSILVPIVLIVLFSIVSETIVKEFGKTWLTYSILPILGLLLSFLTYIGFQHLSKLQAISPMNLGSVKGLVLGITLGIVVSLASAYLFYLSKTPDTQLSFSGKVYI